MKIYGQICRITTTVSENIIVTIKMRKYYWYPLKMIIFQYCDSNIGLLLIAPHSVITLPTLSRQKLSLLISLLPFCISFVDWFMVSLMYCFLYSFRSPNYCDSNSYRSFTLLKALDTNNGNLFAIALKKERQLSLAIVDRAITLEREPSKKK